VEKVNIHQAKTHLSRLIDRAEHGEEIVIARNGKPVAKLVAFQEKPLGPRRFGTMRGQFEVPDDFDDPLPDDLLALFYGEAEE
jgi:prevent-host-death family protein